MHYRRTRCDNDWDRASSDLTQEIIILSLLLDFLLSLRFYSDRFVRCGHSSTDRDAAVPQLRIQKTQAKIFSQFSFSSFLELAELLLVRLYDRRTRE